MSPRRPRPHPQPAAQDGVEVELDVTTVAHGGVMVARHDGRVIFLADAIPGERVVARVTDSRHDRFWRADTVRVLSPSPHRRPHVWPEASVDRDVGDRAGGAEFGHIALEYQRELKTQVLHDSLSRFAGLDSEVAVEAIGSDPDRDGLAWRTRVDLHVDADGRIGPYAARSHRVIPVAELPLATEAIQAVAPLDVRVQGASSVRLLAPSVGPVRLLVDGGEVDADGYEIDGDPAPVVERVGGRSFSLDVDGFWQVHSAAAATLSSAVADAVTSGGREPDPRATHLDLYGGVGLFAGVLADLAGRNVRIESVEEDARATGHAAKNLIDLGRLTTTTARVGDRLRALVADPGDRRALAGGTIVLDPPRSGAGHDIVALLASLEPARIVYVACDPVALARDLATFRELGWQVTWLRALDLFPHTHHLEVVACVDRSVR